MACVLGECACTVGFNLIRSSLSKTLSTNIFPSLMASSPACPESGLWAFGPSTRGFYSATAEYQLLLQFGSPMALFSQHVFTP